MTQTISVNAIARESLIPRDSVEWVEHAYLGEVGTGKLLIHDSAGTVVTTGHKTVIAVQDAASPTRLYTGYVGEKSISRGEFTVGASRFIEVQLNDLNTLLSRKVISGTDGKRSAETVSARLTWLLASDYLTGLVSDFGAVSYATAVGMDRNDYRGQKPGDVLAAMAQKAQFNYYVRWHAGSAAPELVFRDDNAGTADASTLRISNVAADVDNTVTFAPFQDATLRENPDDVYSGVYATYAKGAVYETRAATGTAFVSRDGTTDDSGNKTAAAASLDAEEFLWQSHTEEHILSVTLRLPAAKVNLVRAGDRIQVKMSHLATEGYGSFTWFRVLRRRVTQPLNTDNDYDVAMDLSPQEAAEPAVAIVQRTSGRVGPVSGDITFANPVAIGNTLVVFTVTRDTGTPPAPNTSPTAHTWGTAAWTRLNGAAETSAEHGAGAASGIAAYYKTADATSQSCDFGPYECVGAWELSGVDMASVTLATKDAQTTSAAPATMDIGSLGSPATGELVLMGHVLVTKANTPGFGDYRPILASTPSAGWTQRFWNGPADFSYGTHPATYYPLASFCDGLGAGAAVTGQLTRPQYLADPNGVDIADDVSAPTAWAGIAIKIPPL